MARVPYVDAPTAPNDAASRRLADLYAEIGGLRGSVLNLYRALANQPPALRAFMAMSRYVRDDAELPANLRELAVLATFEALRARLPLPQVVDLALTVGWYHLCAAVLGPLRIETEAETAGADSSSQ